MHTLELENLSFTYDGGKENLFSSLSLHMDSDEKILLIGEPGVGKTTLAKILTGSVPKFFEGKLEGRILVDGSDVIDMDIPERSSLIARSSQNTDSMLLFTSAEDEIAFPLENNGEDDDVIEKKVLELLAKWDLSQYRDSDSSLLSGGEKRRLSLSVLDAVDPVFRVYDEPFDELSHEWRRKLASILKSGNGGIIVLASHYIEEYEGLFDREFEIRKDGIHPYEGFHDDLRIERAQSLDDRHELRIENIRFSQSQKASSASVAFHLNAREMHVGSGELVLLKGDNGSGKSTLSKIITGLRKEEKGKVLLDGAVLSEKKRRETIAYLHQNPYNQLFLPTVRDEALTVTADEEKLKKVFSIFGFTGDEYVEELSQGKAKLVQAMVFYLLERPFAILDELDSALSYKETAAVLSLFLRRGDGVLLISHDDRMLELADRIYHIEGGTLHD